jgi:hypothetical protein
VLVHEQAYALSRVQPNGSQPSPQPTEGPMPSAAAHEIPRSHTPLEVASLLATIVVSAGVGLLLFRWK